jgi:hypothetical protein
VERQEARLLRYLCNRAVQSDRVEIIETLKAYRFATVHHQVLFDCLRGLAAAPPELLESLLPVRLVRAGFPDFDLEPFLRPSGLSASQARAAAKALSAK